MRNASRAAWERWKGVAEKIAHSQTRFIFAFLYFTIVAPFAIGLRIASDPLKLKHPEGETFWHPMKRQTVSLEDAHRQF